MKLISCDGCGVVIDREKLEFPDIFDGDGNIDDDKAACLDDEYFPKTNCPVCGEEIIKV